MPATKTLVTDFGTHKADVANVIPPQKAGAHRRARRRRRPHRLVPDRSGHLRVEARAEHPRDRRRDHRRRACRNRRSRPMRKPKSAPPPSRSCWPASKPAEPKLINTCYSLVAPDYGITVAGVYQPVNGVLAEVKGSGGVSPLDAPRVVRARRRRVRRWLVQDHHRRGVRLRRVLARRCMRSLAGCGIARRTRRRRCGPIAVVGDAIPALADRRRRATPARGRAIVANRQVGLCLLCHSGPFPEERFQGRSRRT